MKLYATGSKPVTREGFGQMNELNTGITRGLDFKMYPSQLCSHYVKGMPVQTFEALLQICSTCIYWYALAADETYNSQGVSMLQSESYFSDVKRLDKDGYPKGPMIHKLIGKSVTVNAYKHKATK